MYLDNNQQKKKVHSPIVGVEMYDGDEVYDPTTCKIQKHAVVLSDNKLLGF